MTQGPAVVADAVRARLVAVEAICAAFTSTVGAFPNPQQVYEDVGRIVDFAEDARRALERAWLVRA